MRAQAEDHYAMEVLARFEADARGTGEVTRRWAAPLRGPKPEAVASNCCLATARCHGVARWPAAGRLLVPQSSAPKPHPRPCPAAVRLTDTR